MSTGKKSRTLFPPSLRYWRLPTSKRYATTRRHCRKRRRKRAAGAVLNYPWLNIADNHGFIEIAASGRMKKNFYTSEKTVQAQLGCYEQALADIICYMREIV